MSAGIKVLEFENPQSNMSAFAPRGSLRRRLWRVQIFCKESRLRRFAEHINSVTVNENIVSCCRRSDLNFNARRGKEKYLIVSCRGKSWSYSDLKRVTAACCLLLAGGISTRFRNVSTIQGCYNINEQSNYRLSRSWRVCFNIICRLPLHVCEVGPRKSHLKAVKSIDSKYKFGSKYKRTISKNKSRGRVQRNIES